MSFNCSVITKSELKKLSNAVGYSEDVISVIADEYKNHPSWWEAGNSIPSVAYLMNYFYRDYEGTDNEIKIWNEYYSTPQVFDDWESMLEAKIEAQKYFRSGQVVDYKNPWGKYVLMVAQPVKALSLAANDPEAYKGLLLQRVQKQIDNILNGDNSGLYSKFNTTPQKFVSPILEAFQRNYGSIIKLYKRNGKWVVDYDTSTAKAPTSQSLDTEMQSIKEQAVKDGTFMKAPNGKPTNLNERQWLHVRTKNFINWFGDWINDPNNASKVVDKNGEPLVVYRGERGESKNILDTNQYGHTFFVNDGGIANSYNKKGNNTRKFFLNIRTPKEVDAQGEMWDAIPLGRSPQNLFDDVPTTTTQEIAKNLTNEGFDGGIIKNVVDFGPNAIHAYPSTDFIITDANQAKSATDNTGEFSSSDDDITRAPISQDQKELIKSESEEVLNKTASVISELMDKNRLDVLQGHMQARLSKGTINNLITSKPVGSSMTVSELLTELIADPNTSDYHKAYATALLSLAENKGYKVLFADAKYMSDRKYGKASVDDFAKRGGITSLNPGTYMGYDVWFNVDDNFVKTMPTWVILHEITHVLTYNALYNNNFADHVKAITGLKDYVVEVLKANKNFFEANGSPYNIYGLTDINEFVAEAMSNKKFQELLKSIPAPDRAEHGPQSAWDKLVSIITSILRKYFGNSYNTQNSVFDALSPIVSDIMTLTSMQSDRTTVRGNAVTTSRYSVRYGNTLKEFVSKLNEATDLIKPSSTEKTVTSTPIVVDHSLSGDSEIVITSPNNTSNKAKEINGIDTLRHPDSNGMHFGNPFSHTQAPEVKFITDSAKSAVDFFDAWLTGAETYAGVDVAKYEPQRRQWIVDQILNGSLKGRPLVYYTTQIPDNSYSTTTYNPETAPNHAMILQKYINDPESFKEKLEKNKAAVKPEKKIVSYFRVSDTPIDKKSKYTKELFLDVPVVAEINDSDKLTQIKAWLANGTIPTGALLKIGNLSKEDVDLLDSIGNLYRCDNGFTVDYSDKEIDVIKQNDKLLTSTLFTSAELRNLARNFVFKMSDAITQLESNNEIAKKAFGIDKDLTAMSRIDIISTVGLSRLAKFVAEGVFTPRPETDGFSLVRKKKLIQDNLDAFLRLGYDSLIDLEEISPTGSYNRVSDEITGENAATGEVDTQNDIEIQETKGDAAETWQVGFRQISAFAGLSKLLKRSLSKFYILDKDKHFILNDFDLADTVNSTEAVSKILKWTQGATTFNQMVDRLKTHLEDEPWLNQLVGEYYIGGDEANGVQEGLLVQKGNDQFKTQFFTNFKKYFQVYAVVYKEKGKETRLKFINRNPYIDRQMTLLATKIAGKSITDGRYNLWYKEDGNKGRVNTEALDTIEKNVEYLRHVDVIGDEEAKKIKAIYDLLDIESPTLDMIKGLFSLKSHLQDLVGDGVSNFGYAGWLVKNLKRMSTITDASAFNPLADKSNVSNFKNMIGLIAGAMNDNLESVNYEAGKLYYSYVMPSYLSKLTDKFHQNDAAFEEFLQREYKDYRGWFYNDAKGSEFNKANMPEGHMNYFLSILEGKSQRERSGLMEHVVMLSRDRVAYSDKTPAQYMASMIEMFFYDTSGNHAYYRVPTLSNKPSEEYIKFERMGATYQEDITDWLVNRTFYQELSRIWAVQERREKFNNGTLSEECRIENYDDSENGKLDARGAKFQFLDYLNDYLDVYDRDKDKKVEDRDPSYTFGEMLHNIITGNMESSEYNFDFPKEFIDGLKTAIKDSMNSKFNDFLRNLHKEGMIRIIDKGDDIVVTDVVEGSNTLKGNVKEMLREFFWQDNFATQNILQLTISDIAFYKDSEDLQKRLAQLHAPGTVPNIQAEYGGKPVTDGNTRTIYIADNIVKSDILPNLDLLWEKMQAKYEKGTPQYELMKSQIATIRKAFEGINVADAQGYTSITGYRKKMILFGKWTDEDEAVYNKIKNGDFSDSDLSIVWQPLKPFVYSQIGKPSHNALMNQIKIGVQNKNSEYCLIIADALFRANGINSKLSALYDFMEKSHGLVKTATGAWIGTPNNDGIDTIQFASTVKTGKTGVININSLDKKGIEDAFTSRTKNADGTYNKDYVHEIPFSDYSIQQEVPAHFKGEQQMGSQDRVLAIADMPNVNSRGETNYIYMHKLEDGKWSRKPVKMSVKDAKETYYQAIVDNINNSVRDLAEEFKLYNYTSIVKEGDKWITQVNPVNAEDRVSVKNRNIALSRLLQEEILSDARYGTDLLWACSTDLNGNFNIPLSDPTQAYRVMQLLNSIIKNRINKQKIAGGPVVQVSCYGYSDQLNIVFKDSNGKTLQNKAQYAKALRRQWKEQGHTEELPQSNIDSQYETYLKSNQASVAYFECYVPIYDDTLVEDFGDANGNIDIEKIRKHNPKLLEMVGYRIPTEAKYSMVPIRIKGFLPRAAGEGIMLPKEITALSGSDFDIDKLYVMRYSFHRVQDAKASWNNEADVEAFTQMLIDRDEFGDVEERQKQIKQEVKNAKEHPSEPENVAILDEFNHYKTTKYFVDTKGIGGRNNEILATQFGILTSPMAMDQVLSSGNFEEPKRVGYLIAAMENAVADGEDAMTAYKRLSKLDTKALKDASYKKKSLLYADTQMQFHKQNMVAAKLIGIFAQANVSHAFINLSEIPVTMDFVSPFSIRTTGNIHPDVWLGECVIDKEYSKDTVNRVSGLLASYLAASVDAVKDPILNLMNINLVTANAATTLARLGYSAEFIGMLLSHPIIKELVVAHGAANAKTLTPVTTVLNDMMDKMRESNKNLPPVKDTNFILDEEDLIKAIGGGNRDINDDYNVLGAFANILRASEAFRLVTHMTKFNSITSAVGPSAAETSVSRMNCEEFRYNNKYITQSLKDAADNPILKAFRDGSFAIESELLGNNLIQASVDFTTTLRLLKNRLGYMNADIARKLTDFYMAWVVNKNNPVFDHSLENRKSMIDDFPMEFEKLKQNYPTNVFLGAITIDRDRADNPILVLRTKGLESTEIQNIRSSWADLFAQELSEGKAAKDTLAVKLMEYCYFVGSFGFSPKTFMQLVPNVIKRNLPNYISNLANHMPVSDYDNLINQFMLNTGIVDIKQVNESDLKLSTLDAPSNDGQRQWYAVGNPEALSSMGYKYYGIAKVKKADGSIAFAEINNAGDQIKRLRWLTKLGGDNQGFEIDPNTKYFRMQSVWESTVSVDSPDSSIEGGVDPELIAAEASARLLEDLQIEQAIAENSEAVSDDEFEGLDALEQAVKSMPSYSPIGGKFASVRDQVQQVLNEINPNMSKEEADTYVRKVEEIVDNENLCN